MWKKNHRRVLTVLIICVALVLLYSCVTYSEEEREWRQQVDRENFVNCMAAVKMSIHRDHTHVPNREPRRWEIRQDLGDNYCRQVLGDYWIEY